MTKSAWNNTFSATSQLSKVHFDHQRIIFQGKNFTNAYGQAKGGDPPPPSLPLRSAWPLIIRFDGWRLPTIILDIRLLWCGWRKKSAVVSLKTSKSGDGNLGQEHNKSEGGRAIMAMDRLTRPLVVVRCPSPPKISDIWISTLLRHKCSGEFLLTNHDKLYAFFLLAKMGTTLSWEASAILLPRCPLNGHLIMI